MSNENYITKVPALPIQDGKEFCSIEGWPGYAVNDAGEFWSCKKQRLANRYGAWRRIIGLVEYGGYIRVSLCDQGEIQQVKVHTLVLEAFIGKRPVGQECRHLNGNPADNRLVNICWGSHLQNVADSIRHGTNARGEKHHKAKLTEDDVREIRRRHKRGENMTVCAKQKGVTQTNVSCITTGKTWKHIA